MAGKTNKLRIEGHDLRLSNLDKVFFRGGRFTKANVIDYYIRVSDYLLPHLRDRPVTLKRFPNGIYGEFFYEKDAPSFTPEWVETYPVPRSDPGQPDIRYILINDLATLVWLANLANLEIHPFLHQIPKLDQPTWIVFDLDPGEGADILTCARVSFWLRNLLTNLKLKSFAKVSGSKGLQVYVPLNTPVTYAESGAFAKALAEFLAHREPNLVVAEMAKTLRRGKVFIDWSQNAIHKTTVGIYSLRAKTHRPYVSMPVHWDELEQAVKDREPDSLYFDPPSALERIERVGDLFAPLLKIRQHLPRSTGAYRRQSSARRASTTTLSLRASRQGGRRRFLLRKANRHQELLLETHQSWRSWRLPAKSLFAKQNLKVKSADDIEHAAVDFPTHPGKRKSSYDFGIYDLIEGDFKSGFFKAFVSGQDRSAEITAERMNDGSWQFGISNVRPVRPKSTKPAPRRIPKNEVTA